jgi:hypothetical protein
VTIGIAAVAHSGHIIAVSDQRISFYDQLPPIEKGMQKLRQITADGKWFLAFAAGDIPPVAPLLRKIIGAVNGLRPEEREIGDIMTKVSDAYSDIRDAAFVDQYLRAIDYRTLREFRQEGLKDLGKDEHQKHMMELLRFSLEVELLIFGHDNQGLARIFEVRNPGEPSELTWRRYAAVGSGHDLAVGSIAQRPLPTEWPEIVYRLLGAKFVAEDARDVGKEHTTAIVVGPGSNSFHEFSDNEIQEIRRHWNDEQARPTPQGALDVIEAHDVIRNVMRGNPTSS